MIRAGNADDIKRRELSFDTPFFLYHQPRQYHTGNQSRQRREQRARQRITRLRHLRRHEIHTHRIENRLRAGHTDRPNQSYVRICPEFFEQIQQ